MEDTILTLKTHSEGIYKEKGSKFFSFAYPVNNEEEIKQHIEYIKKKYFDARHHCYAYILGKDQEHYRANDDGEPNHSAGDPILGQIRSRGLTNTLVIVVRYFGGVKLGVGGLVQAYKTAAAEALDNNETTEEVLQKSLVFSFDYTVTNEVMRLVKRYGLEIASQKFSENCIMEVNCRMGIVEGVVSDLESIESLGWIRC